MGVSRILLLAAGIGLAIFAELVSYDAGDDLALTVVDGIVGLVMVASGVIAWDRRPGSWAGPLLGASGLAWFAGNFVPGLVFLHRGPLVHLHISYPTGRLRWWAARVTVLLAYVGAFTEVVARNDWATLGLAALVGAVAIAGFVRTSGKARRAGIPALVAALSFVTALALGAVNRLAGWQADRGVLWVYEIVVAGVATVLLVDLLRGRWADAVVADLVVDLGTRSDTGSLRDKLGRALGDRSLILGYWLADESRYVDDDGRQVDPTQVGDGRVVTPVVHDGQPLAVLIHDIAVLDDPDLVSAVAASARLAISNARLQAQTRERMVELAASRRRIVEAGDAQRRQFEQDIREGVQTHLDDAASRLRDLRQRVDGPVLDSLAEIALELDGTRAELEELARGVHPRALTEDGLAAALVTLRSGSTLPVALDVAAVRLPATVEAAVYFVCSEAVANVAKHAQATRVTIEVTVNNGEATAIISDDGRGAADPSRGSGLLGLADRVEALGGTLTVESETGIGTRVRATLPLDRAWLPNA